MRSLVGMLMVLMVSGDANVSYVTGSVGDDVLLPCNCSKRNPAIEFRWQAEVNGGVLVVKHNGITSNFTDKYKDRAELFLSKDESNCSLLLKNITLEDEVKYTCSFKDRESLHKYFYVNLTVSERIVPNTLAQLVAPTPGPTEPTSPDNVRTLCRLMPIALVAVLSLFLFFLYKRKVPGRLNAGEEEKALRIPV